MTSPAWISSNVIQGMDTSASRYFMKSFSSCDKMSGKNWQLKKIKENFILPNDSSTKITASTKLQHKPYIASIMQNYLALILNAAGSGFRSKETNSSHSSSCTMPCSYLQI